LTLLLSLAAAVACGKGDGASAGGVAGEVVRAEGTVVATRAATGAPARPLAAGESIYADDTIVTGNASAVEIRLAHNGALWQLGANTSRRVDASAAWRAEKGGEVAFGKTDVDRTAAAGRHGEREASTTRAVEPPESDQADGLQLRGIDQKDVDDTGGEPRGGEGGRYELGKGGGGSGDDSIGLGEIGTIGHGSGSGTGSGYGQGGGGRGGGSNRSGGALTVRIDALEVDGGLAREVVQRVMRQKYTSFKRCYEHELGRDESFSAEPELSFSIGQQGRLSPITVSDVPAGSETFESCLEAAARAVRMPSADAETSVRFRLIFSRQ